MMTKSAILGKLSPFQNYNKVLVEDQSTNDIIKGILSNHEQYKNEYDRISESFVGDSIKETARNVWNFLKTNVPYYIEPINKQTLRSPSAILVLRQGADCKSYATFANGIFDSLNRKGLFNAPIAFRFASYREDVKDPQHVFSVIYPGTDHEIWVDPVLDRFNQHKQPNYYKDKKINMALIAMSGTSQVPQASLQEMQSYRDKLVRLRDKGLNSGAIVPGSAEEIKFKEAINKVTRCIQDSGLSGVNDDGQIGMDWSGIFNSLLQATPGIITATKGQPQYPGGSSALQNYYQNYPSQAPTQTSQSSSLFSMSNILLIGAVGLGAYFLIKK